MAKRNPNRVHLRPGTISPPSPPVVKIPHRFHRPLEQKRRIFITPKHPDTEPQEDSRSTTEVDRKEVHKLSLEVTPTHISSHYNSPQHSDTQVRLADNIYYLHRMVLLQIEFFSGLFSSGMSETKTGVIELQDVDPVCLERMFLFAYDRSIEFNTFEEVTDLLDVAYYFQFPRLQSAIWELVDRYRHENISTRVLSLMKDAQYNRSYTMTSRDLQEDVLQQLPIETVKTLQLHGRQKWLTIFKWLLAHPDEMDTTLLHFMSPEGITWEDTQMLMTFKDDPRLSPFIITALSTFISRLTSWTMHTPPSVKSDVDPRGRVPEIHHRPLALSEICLSQPPGTTRT